MRNTALVMKRYMDVILSVFALIFLLPVFLIAAVGIKIQSPGPVIYRAKRMGKNMQPFNVYKFRTMHVGADKQGNITAVNDNRVFTFGNVLRKLKIDELPQLINVLNGTMSIIGPRPEDVEIVKKNYSDWMKKTLNMLPGLASPGSIFNYTHGALYLNDGDLNRAYVEKLMPLKLAMDYYYVNHFSLLYDLEIIIRTVWVIITQLFGKTKYNYPKEYKTAKQFIKKHKSF